MLPAPAYASLTCDQPVSDTLILVMFAPFPVKLTAVTIPENEALPFEYMLAATPILIPPVAVTSPALTANNDVPAPIRKVEPCGTVLPAPRAIPNLSKR